MFVSFVWVYSTMDLTKACAKHQYIIDSLTDPLVFAGQQMQVAPVHGFYEGIAKLQIIPKHNVSFVKLLKECGKNINIDHYITLLTNHVPSQHPQRSFFKLVFTIEGSCMLNPINIHTPISTN